MSGGPDARLFAALELAQGPVESLVGWAREAARAAGSTHGAPALRVLPADSLHLTLCFLGSRPADEIDGLLEALAGACQGAVELELSLGAPAWLPPRRPRALAVEIHGREGALGELQGAVERALSEEPAGRRYRPHVTVARAREGILRPSRIVLPPTPSASFRAGRVALMRSFLEPRGARYETQGSFTLEPWAG